jgi:3-hydroxymyristoyl/3-hydroxydecanoyl-(acyl carrier protein) dehydratase
MDGPTITDSIVTSSFIFPPDFIGFQGHFPTRMVLPGACQIQCALSTLEKALGKRVELQEIQRAKYVAPVFPDDHVVCTMSRVPDDDDTFIYTARISKGATKVTELKLRISLSDAL